MKNEELGPLIRNLRRFISAKGYSSVEKFAYENRLSKGGIGKILQGKRIPRFDTVVNLAKALDVTLNDLYPLGTAKLNEYVVSKRLKLEKVKAAHNLLSDVLKVSSESVSGKRKKSEPIL